MSHGHHAPELPYCRNCHFTLATPRPVYCGHCGQETDLHPPSVREMVTEYVGHYVAFDGPLWRTLVALLFMPGFLTNAYFHGRRRRYVLPLRVYLSASFIFFIGLALLPQGPTQVIETDPAATTPGQPVRLRVQPASSPAETAAAAEALSLGASAGPAWKSKTQFGDCDPARPQTCDGVAGWMSGFLTKARSMTIEQWTSRVRALAPYALLAMQPLFAALLLVAFAGHGRRYAEHFVFSLHSHSFWYLALLLAMAAGLEEPMLPVVFLHGVLALRRVYGVGWRSALWRSAAISAGYLVLLTLVAMALAILIATTA